MDKMSWTDRVRKEVRYSVKEGRNNLSKLKRRQVNRIANIWRRNCLIKHAVEGIIGGDGRKTKKV